MFNAVFRKRENSDVLSTIFTPIPPKAAEYVSSSKAAMAWEINNTPGDSALFVKIKYSEKVSTEDEISEQKSGTDLNPLTKIPG